MTLENVLQQVRQLSDSEKLALIESTANMLQKSRSADNVVDENNLAGYLTQQRHKLVEIINELMDRPDPIPAQMMRRGIFKDAIVNEPDFKAAEWHPSDDELDNAAPSIHH
jgi:hypothetical protein